MNQDKSLKAAVRRIKRLRQEEEGLVLAGKRNLLEATLKALEIGRIIYQTVKGEYGSGAMQKFAEECGFSKQTAYDYLHLARGALSPSIIKSHPELNREYFQAIGSSIDPTEDAMGMMLFVSLTKNPLFIEDNPDEKKPNTALIKEVATIINDCRKHIRDDLKVLHIFKDYTPVMDDGDEIPSYAFNVSKEEEASFQSAQDEMARAFHDISQKTGWPERIGIDLGSRKTEVLKTDQMVSYNTAKGITVQRRQQRHISGLTVGVGPGQKAEVLEKIFLGDCREVLKDAGKFPEHSIDAVVTDPPYGDKCYGAGWRPHVTVVHEAEPTPEAQAFLVGQVAETLVNRHIIKDKFIWFSFFPIDYAHVFVAPILKAFDGLDVKHQVLIWDKRLDPKLDFSRTFARRGEGILYVNIGRRPLGILKKSDGRTKYLHSNIIPCLVEKKTGSNVFWKPVPLLEELVRLATGGDWEPHTESQIVLDPFAGTGSTGVACINKNRDYRLIEIIDEQFRKAVAKVNGAIKRVR